VTVETWKGRIQTKVISVNVGLPIDILVGDKHVSTGIFKRPVSGTVLVRRLNLDGDRQADLKVHGGPDKAVYAYPSEHYPFWQRELGQDLAWGAFGENLTVEGLSEDTLCIGDTVEIGTSIFQVSQPRLPCYKLAAKFQRDDMIRRFLDSRRVGFYLRVLQEGALASGDPITLAAQDPRRLTIREITDLYVTKNPARSLIERALSVEPLANSWREHFTSLLYR
jgi:MOSC domain-containing protein YiiM